MKEIVSLDSKQVVNNIVAGLVIGLLVSTLGISLAALIFSGPMSSYVSRGIGIFLFGGFAFGLTTFFVGTVSGSAIGPQDGPVALIAVATTGITATMIASAIEPDVIYSTIIAMIMASSFVTGLVFVLIGQFKLGNLVRYIPFPVVGGFLAGTGWLLTRGAIEVMVGEKLSIPALLGLFHADKLLLWLPGTIYAIVILFVLRKVNHFLVWPGIIFAAIAIFYFILLVTGTSIEDARQMGFLLEAFPSGGLWQPFTLSNFQQVDWGVLADNAALLIPVPIVGLVGFLLNATSLELVTKSDIDLNKEIRSTGLSNIISGLGGGPPGFHYLSPMALAYRMEAKTRVVTLTMALFFGLVILAGGGFISYMPVALLSSLLLVLGLSFLIEWVYDSWFKMPILDYSVVLISLIVIVTKGFLEGVGVGVVASTIIFVYKYSRINTVRDSLNGRIYHSKVNRPSVQRQTLHKYGEGIHIFRLQGYIFFGTADGLLARAREILEDEQVRERFIVLDFHRVNGLDSSAVSSFNRMHQLAEVHDVHLVITQAAPEIKTLMAQGGFKPGQYVQFFLTLDHGVEWCENMLLQRYETSTMFIQTGFKSQLATALKNADLAERLLTYLERMEVPANFYLMRRGEPSDSMYFVDKGRLNILIETDEGEITRLGGIRAGAVVGEMGMYLKDTRTANVVTVQDCVLYRLSFDAMKEVGEKDPEVASALHEWLAHQLAERIADNNRALEALLD